MRKTLRTLGLILIAATLFQSAGASEPTSNTAKRSFIERVLELTNKEREKVGLQPLVLDPKLSSSADWKAEDMGDKDYFDHADGAGRDFVDRAEKFGYNNWTYLGENIAAGQPTPEEVVQEWMASPGHRKNILKPQYREIGIGYASISKSSFKNYWVQEFGTR